jgi:hypothetical protein
VRLEGLGQLKNPVTSSGFEPVTSRIVSSLVACTNRCSEEGFVWGGAGVTGDEFMEPGGGAVAGKSFGTTMLNKQEIRNCCTL